MFWGSRTILEHSNKNMIIKKPSSSFTSQPTPAPLSSKRLLKKKSFFWPLPLSDCENIENWSAPSKISIIASKRKYTKYQDYFKQDSFIVKAQILLFLHWTRISWRYSQFSWKSHYGQVSFFVMTCCWPKSKQTNLSPRWLEMGNQ